MNGEPRMATTATRTHIQQQMKPVNTRPAGRWAVLEEREQEYQSLRTATARIKQIARVRRASNASSGIRQIGVLVGFRSTDPDRVSICDIFRKQLYRHEYFAAVYEWAATLEGQPVRMSRAHIDSGVIGETLVAGAGHTNGQ